MNIINQAVSQGRKVLTEFESKKLLADYGIPVTEETLVHSETELKQALTKISLPVVLKACSPEISHKTERNLVRLDLRSSEEVTKAFNELQSELGSAEPVLIQEMIAGKRELMVGLTRDAQFGPCVMFGLGGIFTEILKDVSFRMAPLSMRDAGEMMTDIKAARILDSVRGMPAVDLEDMKSILVNVGKIGLDHETIQEIDINPLIISGSKPVVVDALIILK